MARNLHIRVRGVRYHALAAVSYFHRREEAPGAQALVFDVDFLRADGRSALPGLRLTCLTEGIVPSR